MEKVDHIINAAADEVIRRFPEEDVYTCESGWTPSGKFHIGNFLDVVVCDAVYRELVSRGYKARHIFIADSRDPFVRAPAFAPSEFIKQEHQLEGKPFENIYDPWGCHSNYAEHFVEPLRLYVEEYGVNVEIKMANEIHNDEEFVKLLLAALEKRGKVTEIMNEIREKAGHDKRYPIDWVPYAPICNECKRVCDDEEATINIKGHKLEYLCNFCDNSGVSDIEKGEGKPPWRLDWPLRWMRFRVDFEPMGKDHMAAGSSFYTAREVIQQIFNWREPVPIFYEFVYIWDEVSNRPEKVSGRWGRGPGIEDWIKIAPPEVLRFKLLSLSSVPNIDKMGRYSPKTFSHFIFRPNQIPTYVEEYSRAERLFFKDEGAPSNIQRLRKTYALSQVGPVPRKMPVQIPHKFAAVLSQIVGVEDTDTLTGILLRTGHLPKELQDDDKTLQLIKRRVALVRNWVELMQNDEVYGVKQRPVPELKVTLSQRPLKELTKSISDKQRRAILTLAKKLKEREWSASELEGELFTIARQSSLKSGEFFSAAYLVLLGKKQGPRLAHLLMCFNRELLVDRLKKVG